MNFIYHVVSYQDNSMQLREKRKDMKISEISNHNFMGSLPNPLNHSSIIGCEFW